MRHSTEPRTDNEQSAACGQVATALDHLVAGIGAGDTAAVLDAAAALTAASPLPDDQASLDMRLHDFRAIFEKLCHMRSSRSLSMTSTNLPDSIAKLSTVLSMSSDATHSVLSILDQQDLLLEHTHQLLLSLEKNVRSPEEACAISSFIQEQQRVLKESRTLMSSLLSTQEYQDLCGQSVAKVMRLNESVNTTVGELLDLFCVGTKHQETSSGPDASDTKPETKVKQDEADDLLKEFGI